MKKFTLFIFSLVIGLITFCGLNVKADGITVYMSYGAQVRTAGDYQGLRFQGSVNTLAGTDEHGFFIALGVHSKSQIATVVSSATEEDFENGTVTVGANKLIKKAATGEDLTFAVTIYDITNTYYTTDITAIAYAYDGTDYILAGSEVTRNIAEIAKGALTDGNNSALVKEVVSYSYYAVNFSSSLKKYIAGNSVYENIVDNIKTEFMNDWHDFDDSISTSDLSSAFSSSNRTSLKNFAQADNNLSTGARKWHWLWGYLSQYNTYKNEVIHLYTDSEEADNDTGYTILYQVYNFFTNSSWKKDIEHSNSINSREIRFWDHPEYYAQVGNFNNTIEADHNDVNTFYVLKGETYILPEYTYVTKDYYNVTGWSDGTNVRSHATSYTLSTETVFSPVYEPITYTVTYHDGEDNITSTFAASYRSFTVESAALTLPTYDKDGYLFNGWYDNSSFTGSAVTSIAAGTHENKEFWAKTTAGDTVEITLAMNDGSGDTTVVTKVKGIAITNVPEKGAYIFNGWYDNAECTGDRVVLAPNTDTTLYAKWTAMTVDSIKADFLADVNASAVAHDIIGSAITSSAFYSSFSEKFMNVTGAAVAGVYPTSGLMSVDSELLAKYGWLMEYIGSKTGDKYYSNTALVAFGLQSPNDSRLATGSWNYCDRTMTNAVHNFLTGTGEILHGGSSGNAVPADFSGANAYDDLLAAAAAANFTYANLD